MGWDLFIQLALLIMLGGSVVITAIKAWRGKLDEKAVPRVPPWKD